MAIDVQVAAPPMEALGALAEPNRWRIVELLSCEELCVFHLADDLDLAQPLVSHHLRVLRDAGLVESEKDQQWTYYRLRREVLEALTGQLGSITSCCPAPGERQRARS